QQPDFGRIDGPRPQQNVENRRTHARQKPNSAEEAASRLVDRRGRESEHEAKGHVEDGERAENVDERQADELRQRAIALKNLHIFLRVEFRDAERAAEVGERHRNIDENGNDEKKDGENNRRAEKDREIGASAGRPTPPGRRARSSVHSLPPWSSPSRAPL